MSSQTLGQDKHISRDGTLKEGPTRRHAPYLNAWKSHNLSTKEEHLLKIISWQKPAVPVLVGRKSEDHLPRHQTPIRFSLASAIEAMQAIREMIWPEQRRHACCMAPDTLQKSVESDESTLRSALRSIPTRTNKPAPATTNAENRQVRGSCRRGKHH